MTIFRNKKDQRLYLLYWVTPRSYTGGWLEMEDYFTHQVKKVPGYLEKCFEKVAVV